MTFSGTNFTNTFNGSVLGMWYVVIYHNIYNTTKLLPFTLKIIQTNINNKIIDGYYYNNTITNYIKNCYMDKFSINSNSPWNLSSCICQNGLQWNNSFSKCIRNCTTDINSNK
jgi:hypothetical protein